MFLHNGIINYLKGQYNESDSISYLFSLTSFSFSFGHVDIREAVHAIV